MTNPSPVSYQRLPGRAQKGLGLTSLGQAELWMASDHLLLVKQEGYTESYKRFYFQDIRMLSISRTRAGAVLNGILALIFLGFASFTVLWNIIGDPYGATFAVTIALTSVIATIVIGIMLNLLFGPTCVCVVHTAVHTEQLSSLGRLRTARRVVKLLHERIEAAQGSFPVAPSVQPPDQQHQAENK